MKPTRDGFGEALLELGRTNKDVVALSGDLEDSARAEWFKKEFPERFVNVGISEQDMVSIASGLALYGKIPFACSFSCFVTTRAYDEIRLSVCYNKSNVKIVGSHGGIITGPDGATAQALEDIAGMRVLPYMSVVIPCDAVEAKKATFAIAKLNGPVYLRLSRPPTPQLTKEEDPFTLGKGSILRDGKNVAIIGCGPILAEALQAAEILAKEKISARIVNMHMIKPIDEALIVDCAKTCGVFVTVEEHQVAGGLGSAVSEVLAQKHPAPIEMVGIRDSFGESGESDELLVKYHLKAIDIAEAARKAIGRK